MFNVGFPSKHAAGCATFLTSNLSKGIDPERWDGIGTDPLGGVGVAYLPVPEAPTTNPRHRYFGHLSTVVVPDFYLGELVGLRQSIVIGTRRQADEDSEAVYTEQEQISPFWAFPDGNVTWFVTWTPGSTGVLTSTPPALPGTPNFSSELKIGHAAWLAKSVNPYLPLNGGMPPGVPVATLDKLTSLLYNYRVEGFSFYEGYTFIGPGRFDLFVSVRQTDPERNRGNQPVPAPVPTRIEDIFVRDNPMARYMSVAGDLAVRIVPFSTFRSTALDRRASSMDRETARFWMNKFKETYQVQMKDESLPLEERVRAADAIHVLKGLRKTKPKPTLEWMQALLSSKKKRKK